MKIVNKTYQDVREGESTIQKTPVTNLPDATELPYGSLIHIVTRLENGNYESKKMTTDVFKQKIYDAVQNTFKTSYWDTHEVESKKHDQDEEPDSGERPNGTAFADLVKYLEAKDSLKGDSIYPIYTPTEVPENDPNGFIDHLYYDFDLIKRYMVVKDGEDCLIAKAPTSTSSLLSAIPAEQVSETIINVNSLDNAFVIDVSTVSSSGFTIQCADGKYLGTTNTNNLATSESTTTNYYIWSISFNEDGASLKSRTRYLKYDPAKKVFGGYSNTSSTTFPDLYYLPDSHVAEDRLLKESIPGFYPLRGNRRIYTAGSDQMSIYKTASGEVTFSILNPKELTVMQITGLRETLQKEQVLSIVEVNHTKKSSTQKSPQPYRVIQVRDDKAWLLHPSGDGYIVRIR